MPRHKVADPRAHKPVLQTKPVADAEAFLTAQPRPALTVTIGDVDLPAFVSDGILYIQAPLPHVFQAFAEDISDFVSDLEVRVSNAWGGALSLDRNGRPVHSKGLAESGVVRSGGKQ